jgi:hypothetical protein
LKTGFLTSIAILRTLAHDGIAAFFAEKPAAFASLNATRANNVGQWAIFNHDSRGSGANSCTVLAHAERFEMVFPPLGQHIGAMSHAQFTTSGAVTAILGDRQEEWHFWINAIGNLT